MTWRIEGLTPEPFRPLFALTDAELEMTGARRMTAEQPNTAPCRVSLIDAEPGERLILLNHRHLDAPLSPYRAEGPIFVREAATRADLPAGVVPEYLSRRLLSVRAYDVDWMMTDADVVEGGELHSRLADLFADGRVWTVHVHTARRGCYLAAVVRG